ncbi:MAG TPA: phosphatidate cytidylyltransferase [Chloroflexota bacterium]|jgi:phosphatidate cytidylyltransferase|nr:phosphatidate cytidylyltransferase [Chloroflexota bacterium]
MKARVASAAVLLPLAIGLILAGGVPFLCGVIAMCGLAGWEVAALLGVTAGLAVDRRWRAAVAIGAGLLLLGVGLNHRYPGAAQGAAALALFAGMVAVIAGGPPARRSLYWACGVATLVYVAGLGAHFVLLREARQGLGWTLLACAATWSTDIGAFFVGRRLGKRPFFQAISPKKTLEGAIGGLVAGAVVTPAVALAAGLHVPLAAAFGMGLTLSGAAQAGDLFESLLKREAGVKDSGTLIPGHGGILDRIDSLLLVVAVTFYWRLLFP